MTDTRVAVTSAERLDPPASTAPSASRFRTPPPSSREFMVLRPRLLAQVDEGLCQPLTVITGPAGTGKTSLAESWVSENRDQVHVAWLTLDVEHNQAGVFWRDVLEALRGNGIDLAHVGPPLLPDVVDRSFLEDVAALLGDLPDPVVLVLDQLERITDERVLQQMGFVLDAAQPGVRVIATARGEPGVLTRRRRLRGDMAVIQAADLAFTSVETTQLLERHGLDPPDDAVAALQQNTQGWAAGLRLCALAMREHGLEAAPTGGPWAERRLAGYLVDEVLDAMSGNTRDLLLRMCVVDRVEPGLAQALTERSDADRVLRELAGDDLFVTTGNVVEGRWFRIHPLMLEVLREELSAQGHVVVASQHGRAARWYDAQGDFTRAAVHHVAAGSWRESCASVVRNLGVVELLEHRAPRHLAEVLEQLPEGHDAPEVRAVQAAMDLGAQRLDRATERLVGLETLGEAPLTGGGLRASVALIRLVKAAPLCDIPAAVDAWEAMEPALTGVSSPKARAQARAVALTALSSALLWGGDHAAFEQTLGAASEATEADGCEYSRISVRGQQALAAYRRGALRDAARLGEEALRLGRAHGLAASHRTGVGHLAMSAVALEWNDRIGSQRHIENAALTAQVQNEPALGAAVKLVVAYHHALDGRRTLALSTIADVRASAKGNALPTWIGERVVVADAMVRIRCGDVEGAASVLDTAPSAGADWLLARAVAAYNSGDAIHAQSLLTSIATDDQLTVEGGDVYAHLLQARIQFDHGDVPAARRAVRDALRAARPEGRRRPFVEARAWLEPLLTKDSELARSSTWIGTGLASRTRSDDDVVPVLVEPLTSREIAVLGLMAQVMTVADIAEDLHISANTIKTHQKNLYRKLSVARAHDAVRRGRDLGLI
ncbi:LuxR C-terminal-related transcriptional regulator [Nocardioides pacificus]